LSLDQEIKNFAGVVQKDSDRDPARLKAEGEASLLDKLIREYNLERVF
jgi:hypothetical protein